MLFPTKRNLRASLGAVPQHSGKPPSWMDSCEHPLINVVLLQTRVLVLVGDD